MSTHIYRAKPNPAGKDTYQHRPLPRQLLGEWVDIYNDGSQAVSLGYCWLAHQEFTGNCVPKENFTIYWQGKPNETLRPGEVIRVHTGKQADASLMLDVDRAGVHLHSFAESGLFVLNNGCGDTLTIWTKDSAGRWVRLETASYGSNPPEGRILTRSGAKLV